MAAVPLLVGGAPAEERSPDPEEQPVTVYTPTGADPAARPAARLAASLWLRKQLQGRPPEIAELLLDAGTSSTITAVCMGICYVGVAAAAARLSPWTWTSSLKM